MIILSAMEAKFAAIRSTFHDDTGSVLLGPKIGKIFINSLSSTIFYQACGENEVGSSGSSARGSSSCLDGAVFSLGLLYVLSSAQSLYLAPELVQEWYSPLRRSHTLPCCCLLKRVPRGRTNGDEDR